MISPLTDLPRFVGAGVDPGLVTLIEKECRRALTEGTLAACAPADPENGLERSVLLAIAPDEAVFERAVSQPFIGLVEIDPEEPIADTIALITGYLSECDWFFNVSSRHMFGSTLTGQVSARLCQEADLIEDKEHRVLTVLTEAVSNAIIHGNLELQSPDLDSLDAIDAFHAEIGKRLADPVFGRRRVCLRAWRDLACLSIDVMDQGNGYDTSFLEDRISAEMSGVSSKKTGRGLLAIHKFADDVTVDQDGRRSRFRFYVGERDQGPAAARLDDIEADIHKQLAPATQASRILLVDDEPLLLGVMNIHLQNAGFTDVKQAGNGEEAWACIQETPPDIAIIDLEMPGMNGLDLLRVMMGKREYRDIPVIVASAHDSTKLRNSVMSLGAEDFLTKPLDAGLLVERVRRHLENRVLIKELRRYRLRVHQELEAARVMQEGLLPPEDQVEGLRETYGVTLRSHYRTSSELGGDWWGLHPAGPERFAIYTVDFAGHGVGAAINTFRLHTVMDDLLSRDDDPAELLDILNQRLVDLIPRGQFATMLFGFAHPKTNTFSYAAAGSPGPIYGQRGSTKVHVGESSGIPLGISNKATYTNHTIQVPENGFLFLYSDALIETDGVGGTPPLEVDGLMRLVSGVAGDDDTSSPLRRILDQFYAGAELPLKDDLTAIWLER